MQGQRSSVEPFPEAFEFDNVSSSSNSAIDQQMYWNNMLLDPVETQNLPDYLVSPSDANMSYVNMAARDDSRLGIWNAGESSSREHSLNHGSHDEIKMEHGWAPLTINMGGSLRIEERRFEAASMLSLENANINLNATQVDNEQSVQDSNLNDLPRNSEHNAGLVDINSEVSEARLCPHPTYTPGLLELEHVPSLNGPSNFCGNSSGGIGFMPEDGDGRPGSSLDGRRLACKRKNIGGVPAGSASFIHQGENSLLHSASSSYNPATGLSIGSSSDYLSVANPSEGQLNAGFGTIMREVDSECYPSASTAGNADNSRRSFRLRMNPAQQHDISPFNSWSSGNTVRRFNVPSPNQPPFHPIPFSQPLEPLPIGASSSSHGQPHVPVIPGLPQTLYHFPWTGASSSRIGGSLGSVNSEERVTVMREDTNSRNMTINNASDFVSTPDMRHLVQDRTNRNLSDRSTSIAGNGVPTSQTGTTSVVHPTVGSTWVSHQNPPNRYPQSLTDGVRRSSLPSGGSESGGQMGNFSLQRSGHSITSQGRGHQSGAVFRGHQQLPMRSAFLMDQQNDNVFGVPLTMRSIIAAREGRSRMISEIRSALESMRRVGNLRFEDILILDQSAFYGVADLHDRHRDMRLDVDNMSYEELLALEERIGNVSTGLSEEVILKCLKQRKYLLGNVEESMEVEPCCICQEEYVQGEDLGMLDCGHEFHTACIKQWLTHKNLCPICKSTALAT
ncbi:probable E3 ubiquitin-protein ligase HIP1 [Phoenix dactylifera]|uniref:RING-type E3 ubiquitin transferase n=1 Tax=Phoenix dactylifera TaxID=42345 RepID=A0A8B9ATP9_PHODC|nr:probable E3 ubiquitin-protein ligase HIP1 [Phoenix dactylifera]XP_038987272.1 probable E3 ubiquitin-protein ligase HIP1 [Phoenix dactylifera]XP_038987273.1 probable E3 ubiquitin-protein ligase HIP1 [Phoenix dactylifera]